MIKKVNSIVVLTASFKIRQTLFMILPSSLLLVCLDDFPEEIIFLSISRLSSLSRIRFEKLNIAKRNLATKALNKGAPLALYQSSIIVLRKIALRGSYFDFFAE